MLTGDGIAGANFDTERTLPSGRTHHVRRDELPDELRPAQAVEPGGGEDDGVVLAFFKFSQASVHVAAQRMNLEIRAARLQLGLPSQARCPNFRTVRQIVDARILLRAEGVAGIFARGDRGNFKFGRELGRQVFQAMHREVNTAFDKGLFDLLREHALGADLRQGDVGDFVARCLDDLEFDLVALLAQEGRDVIGLPEGKLRTARSDAKMGHQF